MSLWKPLTSWFEKVYYEVAFFASIAYFFFLCGTHSSGWDFSELCTLRSYLPGSEFHMEWHEMNSNGLPEGNCLANCTIAPAGFLLVYLFACFLISIWSKSYFNSEQYAIFKRFRKLNILGHRKGFSPNYSLSYFLYLNSSEIIMGKSLGSPLKVHLKLQKKGHTTPSET